MIAAPLDKMHVHLTHLMLGIFSPTVISGPTCRPSAVVLWSSVGKPFTIKDAHARPVWTGTAVIIAPHFVRALCAEDCHVISINFDPINPWMASLSSMVGDRGLLPVEYPRVSTFSEGLRMAISGHQGSCVDELSAQLAASLTSPGSPPREMDHRVRAVIARLGEDLSSPPTVANLARDVGLSVDRLSHLLAAGIGMPYRSYVLWRKYRRALALLHEPRNLSWVAQSAGFYDQAHMARTFMNYFGYTPAAVRQHGTIRSQ